MHNFQLQTLCSQVWKKVLNMIRFLKLVHQFLQKTYAVRFHHFCPEFKKIYALFALKSVELKGIGERKKLVLICTCARQFLGVLLLVLKALENFAFPLAFVNHKRALLQVPLFRAALVYALIILH